MNLFELSSQYQSLMQNIMDSDELSDDLIQSIELINDSMDNKILNYTSIIKSINAKAKCIAEAVEIMENRYDKLVKSADRLQETIKKEMSLCDKNKVENAYHEVKLLINNPRVEYIDKNIIPKKFWKHTIKEILEPDTSLISKSLKDGIEIPGAQLVRDTRLSIR